MRTRGKGDPKAMVEKAVARFAEPEARAKLESLPHPSALSSKLGKTLADYTDSRLGPESQMGLNAKLKAIYEIQRALDGGTPGELRDASREAEARSLLRKGDLVFSRRVPGKQGTISKIAKEGVTVKWASGEETTDTALSLALPPGFVRS